MSNVRHHGLHDVPCEMNSKLAPSGGNPSRLNRWQTSQDVRENLNRCHPLKCRMKSRLKQNLLRIANVCGRISRYAPQDCFARGSVLSGYEADLLVLSAVGAALPEAMCVLLQAAHGVQLEPLRGSAEQWIHRIVDLVDQGRVAARDPKHVLPVHRRMLLRDVSLRHVAGGRRAIATM